MRPEEIRAEAIEAVARAQRTIDLGAHPHREDGTPREDWATMTEWARNMYLSDVAPLVDALAEAGLLPTGVEWGASDLGEDEPGMLWGRDGEGAARRAAASTVGRALHRRFVTDWREVTE